MNEDEFISHVKKTLDQQTDALDGETLSKLNQARQAAIQHAVIIASLGPYLPGFGLRIRVFLFHFSIFEFIFFQFEVKPVEHLMHIS